MAGPQPTLLTTATFSFTTIALYFTF
jgi:hypothetical protein